MENIIEEGKKKRGRKPKNQKKIYELNKEQTKFFVDLGNNKEELDLVFRLLEESNNKEHGKEVTFKDIALYGLHKITDKDIDKIKDGSLSEMEKVKIACIEHNKKTGQSLSLGEFLVKKLNIN